jgi:UDP-N-acetylglucosamine 2-epimerase
MKKAALVVGARPQFIKTAPLILELGRFFRTVLIHTGQHYDFMMSDKFFDELNLPEPDYHLEMANLSVGRQTGRMLEGLESVLSFEKPDIAIVVGDTNSTLAGALAAAKLGIYLIHVEAGLRSKDKRLPEQINRVVTDSITECFLCPTPSAVENLKHEGKNENVFDTGDLIYDCLRIYEKQIPPLPAAVKNLPPQFALTTIHRAEAVDNEDNLRILLHSLGTSKIPIAFPVHPRTKKMLSKFGLEEFIPPNLLMFQPVGYADILSLIRLSEFVVTDSGGVQREAIFMGKPVFVARPETEWLEFAESGLLRVSGYEFDLACIFRSPEGEAKNIRQLTRPAAKSMAEIIDNL